MTRIDFQLSRCKITSTPKKKRRNDETKPTRNDLLCLVWRAPPAALLLLLAGRVTLSDDSVVRRDCFLPEKSLKKFSRFYRLSPSIYRR